MRRSWSWCALMLLLVAVPALAAKPRVGIYVTRLDPADAAARDYAKPGWGGGLDVSWPLTGTQGLLSGIGGLEFTSLYSQVKGFQDERTGLRVEQHTDQTYGRFFVGGELGPHGNGFLEPYANLAVALVYYGINTEVVVPDDSNRENDINQHLGGQDEWAFGWSAGTGMHFNFSNLGIDTGVRFLKQYGVPQQLGEGAVTIQPSYIQYRLGLSILIPM
jgi:opacity protein-like surface antigen